MTDVMTNKPLRVQAHATVGPSLMVPVRQVPTVRAVLDRHGIEYWVSERSVALDGVNFVTIVEFGRRADPAHIQAILDSAG